MGAFKFIHIFQYGMAETARFELAVAVTRYDGLANRWFQPLTHVSSEATILWL